MAWHRVRAEDKLAFREDLQSDTTLTDLQKRMISTIATRWDNSVMHAECSLSYIATGAGTTKKMVNKYAPTLAASGRVSKKRDHTHTDSTLWDVNWWYRGSAWVRVSNGGKPISDCRKMSPKDAHDESPSDAHGESPKAAHGSPLELHGGVPHAVDQFPSKDGDIGAPRARPCGAVQGAPKKEEKENPHRAQAGFAKWRIVHAEYVGEDEDEFVAHLRSGKSRKFVLRCHVDSDDYESLDQAIVLDGEAENAVGEMVQMSTNKTGAKTFMRGAPTPWEEIAIISGEALDDGGATIMGAFGNTCTTGFKMNLSPVDVGNLMAECGGESEAIGARVRYRSLPDDTFEFRRIAD